MSRMRRFWTTTELHELRARYADTSNHDLASRFGRTAKAISLMAVELRLKKSPAYLAAHCRYRPGHSTWNKGKSWNPPGSHATRFQKGQRGPQQRRVGEERMDRAGLMVKVAEPAVWIPKARLVWERNFGLIPSGLLVRLKDGDPQNCAPGNLMLISRQDNMRLNGRTRKPRKRRPAYWLRPVNIGVVA